MLFWGWIENTSIDIDTAQLRVLLCQPDLLCIHSKGDLDEAELLAAALEDDDEDEDNSTTAIWGYGIIGRYFISMQKYNYL